MSEKLVASTTNGWTKYVTDTGREKFKRPNGRYANKHQYWGSLSHAEEIDETEGPGFVPPPKEPPEYETVDKDLKTYEKSLDHIIKVNKNLCNPDEQIMWYSLWDDLVDIARKYDTKETEFSFGITYQIITEEKALDPSERHTYLRDLSEVAFSRSDFFNFVDEIGKLCDTYKEVIILDVRTKERIQNNDF